MTERKTVVRQRVFIFGLVIALVFTVTGFEIASASIPDSGGVIHGCMKGKRHQLSVIDTGTTPRCPAGSTELDWSQTSVFEGVHAANQSFSSNTPVGNMTLAAGSYQLTAKLAFTSGAASQAQDDCELFVSGSTDAQDESLATVPAARWQTILLQTVWTFSTAGAVTVKCSDDAAVGSQQVAFLVITAIRVSSVSPSAI